MRDTQEWKQTHSHTRTLLGNICEPVTTYVAKVITSRLPENSREAAEVATKVTADTLCKSDFTAKIATDSVVRMRRAEHKVVPNDGQDSPTKGDRYVPWI